MELTPNDRPQKIGVITHGSLNQGVEMKLDAAESIEDVVAGTFVVIQGDQYDFFSLITDVSIDAANENILLNPPSKDDDLLLRVMQGHRNVREFLGRWGNIRRASDIAAASGCHHVVDGWDAHTVNGQRGTVHRMRMNDDIELWPPLQDLAMKTPLRRRDTVPGVTAIEPHFDDVPRLDRVVVHARRR